MPSETALVRFVDGAENVYLSLTVNSTARTGALMFPVPDNTARQPSDGSDQAGGSDNGSNAGLITGLVIAVVLVGLIAGFALHRRRSFRA